MKNTAVIAFTALCLFLALGTVTSVRRTRRDVSARRGESRDPEAETGVNSEIKDDSSSEDYDFGEPFPQVDGIAVGESDEDKAISTMLIDKNLNKFFNLLEEAGLTESLDSMTNITLFVPTDEALGKPETAAKLKELRADKDKLREVLLFHVAEIELKNCDMVNDAEVKSGLTDKFIRINKISRHWRDETPRYRAECANILHFHNNSCDGTVHEIDELLLPPTKSVYDIIQSDPKYSNVRELLKDTELEEILNSTSPITFLAPVNEAFENLKEIELQELLDKWYASTMLEQHILPGMFCSADMGRYQKRYSIRIFESLYGTMVKAFSSGGRVNIQRELASYLEITQGGSNVVDWDIMATNGVIHSVDKLMMVGDFEL